MKSNAVQCLGVYEYHLTPLCMRCVCSPLEIKLQNKHAFKDPSDFVAGWMLANYFVSSSVFGTIEQPLTIIQ